MPVLQDVPLSAVLDLYQKSEMRVRTLNSKLPESDVEGIIQEVLTRVQAHTLRNNRVAFVPPNPSELERATLTPDCRASFGT